MKIRYICENCNSTVSELEMPAIDEEKLGFNVLTPEERREIIKFDEGTGTMTVNSLCDDCIEALEAAGVENTPPVH